MFNILYSISLKTAGTPLHHPGRTVPIFKLVFHFPMWWNIHFSNFDAAAATAWNVSSSLNTYSTVPNSFLWEQNSISSSQNSKAGRISSKGGFKNVLFCLFIPLNKSFFASVVLQFLLSVVQSQLYHPRFLIIHLLLSMSSLDTGTVLVFNTSLLSVLFSATTEAKLRSLPPEAIPTNGVTQNKVKLSFKQRKFTVKTKFRKECTVDESC